MKKALTYTGVALLVILLALAVAPFLLKDKIRARIDAELASSLNAKVYYDTDRLSLSFFRHFPSLSVSLENFGVVGIDAFEGDTLAAIGRFSASVDVMSLIRGDKIGVNSIELDRPKIRAIVLPDGRANYDIAKKDTTAQDTTAKKPTQFAIQIKRWAMTDGDIGLLDAQTPLTLAIRDMDHEGSGDFTQDIFDLSTKTTIASLSLEYDSTEYLSNKRLDATLSAQIDQPKGRYTLRDNVVKINEMGLGFNGWVEVPAQGKIKTDMTFKTVEGSFKGLLSLIPGVYTKDFEGLKADGAFDLSGMVQGEIDTLNLPRFAADLKVTDGQFQYPKLPSAVTAVGLDVHVEHPVGTLERLFVDLKTLTMRVGKNPVQARAQVRGIQEMQVDGNVKAKLNLAEISQVFPLDGLSLRGLLSVDATAKGVYSQARKRLPAVQAQMQLLDGYVKSDKFPAPIEQLAVQASIDNATGRMEDTRIRIPNMSLVLEGEPFYASALIEDLVHYRWDIAARGTLDLAKITKIYPIADTRLAGRLKADLKTKGAMVDVDAGRYERLPTSGTISLTGLDYKSKDFPQGVKASAVDVAVSPTQIGLTRFDGQVGRSDMRASGSLSNYWAYFLKGQTLKGNLKVESNKFDANEWVSKDPAPAPKPEQKQEMAAVAVPRNLDIVAQTQIGQLLYDNMDMRNVHGQVTVADGILRLSDLDVDMLEGHVNIAGTYDSRDIVRPAYDFMLDLRQVSIKQTYATFGTVRTLAPVAAKLDGKLSTKIRLAGLMNQKMEPLYPTLQGGGGLSITDAKIDELDLVSKLNSVAKLGLPTSGAFKDLNLQGQIINGMLNFKPFDLKVGNQILSLGGQSGFDQSINWDIKTLLPAAAVGATASAIPALAAAKGTGQPVPLTFKMTGTQSAPKLSFAGLGQIGLGAIKDRAKQEVDKLKTQAQDRAKAEADKLKTEGEARARAETDRLKKEAEDRAKGELDKLKDKFKFPR